jgi:hypothetical protein
MDLRERVLRAIDAGTPRPEIICIRGLSLATIGRYIRMRRERGSSVHLKPYPKRTSRLEGTVGAEVCFVGSVAIQRSCHLGAALQTLGARARREDFYLDDEPGHTQARLDLQEKSVGAAERDEEKRSA